MPQQRGGWWISAYHSCTDVLYPPKCPRGLEGYVWKWEIQHLNNLTVPPGILLAHATALSMATDRGVHSSTHLSGKKKKKQFSDVHSAHQACPVQKAFQTIHFLSDCYFVNSKIAAIFSGIFSLRGKQNSLDSGLNVSFKHTCTIDVDFHGTLPWMYNCIWFWTALFICVFC